MEKRAIEGAIDPSEPANCWRKSKERQDCTCYANLSVHMYKYIHLPAKYNICKCKMKYHIYHLYVCLDSVSKLGPRGKQ